MDTFNSRFRIQPDAATLSDHDFIVVQGQLIRYHGKAAHIILPDHVETIGASAFANHAFIRSIYIPDHVTGIQDYAFLGCNQLETVVIGHGIQVIPRGCFWGLASLRTVYLGEDVLEIEEEAFRNCILLENIYTRVRKPLDALIKGQSQAYIRYLTMGMDAGQMYYVNINGLARVRCTADNAFEGCETLSEFMRPVMHQEASSLDVPEEQPQELAGSETLLAPAVAEETEACTSLTAQETEDTASSMAAVMHQEVSSQDSPGEQPQERAESETLLAPAVAAKHEACKSATTQEVGAAAASIVAGTHQDASSQDTPEEQPQERASLEPVQAPAVAAEPEARRLSTVQETEGAAATIATEMHQDATNLDVPEGQPECLSILIPGYQLFPGHIVHAATGREVPDLRVLDLNLTKRTTRALHKFLSDLEEPPCSLRDMLLSDLLRFTKARLLISRWMSYASTHELIREAERHLTSMHEGPESVIRDVQEAQDAVDVDEAHEPHDAEEAHETHEAHDAEETDEEQEEQELFPGYLSEHGVIVHKQSGKTIEDVHIISLPFSVRSKNCLMRGRIKTLSALVATTRDELLNLRNLGMVSFRDILDTASAYLELAQNTVRVVETKSKGEAPIFPEINPEEPVVAPEYAVVKGGIVHRSSFKQIQDAPVEVLGLSARPVNCLSNHGIVRLSMLVGLPLHELRTFRNLGTVSEWEITMRLEDYLAAAEGETTSLEALLEQADEPHQQVNEKPLPRNISPSDILSVFEPDWFAVLTDGEIFARLGEGADERSFRESLLSMLDAGNMIGQDGVYRLVHPSFMDYLNNMYLMPSGTGRLKHQQIAVLKHRAAGRTLEEIGQETGVTRERIRQIENRAVRWICKNAPPVLEDQYRYLFETYRTNKVFYEEHLNNPMAWYYLKSRYQAGTLPAQDALDDKGLSRELRRAIEGWAYQSFIRIEGRYVAKKRSDLEDMVAEKYCQDEKTFDEFVQLYTDFLRDIGLEDEVHLQIDDAVKRSRQNRLAESQTILWKQKQKLRYYDIDGGDYSELLAAMNLDQYQDIELSTRLLMDRHPDIIEQYNIRDEYELHNLLKKMGISSQFPSLVFNRMPMIQFGTFNRDEAVREILFALAPVSADDLVEMISLEYGARPETIKASWLTSIEEYYHQGEYAVDCLELPPEHAALLNEALTDDFYFFTEVRNIYKKLVPQPDLSLISSFNMKRLGFRVNGTYAFRNHQSAEAYFRHLLTQNDFIDLQPLHSRFSQLSAYLGVLTSLRGNYEIIEYEPLKYVKYAWLEAQGLTREDFAAYCDQVYEAALDQGFFTVASMRQRGFSSKLDDLGLDDWFHSSLLRFDERFSYLRMAGNIILRTGQQAFRAGDFYSEVLGQYGSIALGQLLDLLWDHYGLTVDRSKLLEKIKGTSIYFDRIEEVLYARYPGDDGSEGPGG